MKGFDIRELLHDERFGETVDFVVEGILDVKCTLDITYERFLDQLTFEIDYAEDKVCNPEEFDLTADDVAELEKVLRQMRRLLRELERRD